MEASEGNEQIQKENGWLKDSYGSWRRRICIKRVQTDAHVISFVTRDVLIDPFDTSQLSHCTSASHHYRTVSLHWLYASTSLHIFHHKEFFLFKPFFWFRSAVPSRLSPFLLRHSPVLHLSIQINFDWSYPTIKSNSSRFRHGNASEVWSGCICHTLTHTRAVSSITHPSETEAISEGPSNISNMLFTSINAKWNLPKAIIIHQNGRPCQKHIEKFH